MVTNVSVDTRVYKEVIFYILIRSFWLIIILLQRYKKIYLASGTNELFIILKERKFILITIG